MQPTPEEIRSHLDRILASEPFANSGRLSRFLKFVVERTLSGEGDQLKEYVIGTEVFDRGEGYDPRLDSIVRVEAGRLRAKLNEYYTRHGANDAIALQIPRGGYTPVFDRRQTAVSPPTRVRMKAAAAVAAAVLLTGIIGWAATRWTAVETRTPGVSVAVLPFRSYSADDRVTLTAARLTDDVTSELARQGKLSVVSHTSALQFDGVRRPLKEIARSLGADVVLEASVTVEAGRTEVQARLVDAERDRKIWVENFLADAARVDELPRRIATAVSAAATAHAAETKRNGHQ